MKFFCALVVGFVLLTAPAAARDRFLNIQEVTSPGGLTAWLVEDKTLPIVAVRFIFLDTGSALETADKQGLFQLLSNTMDEGAGDLDSQAFQKELADRSVSLSFSSGRDGFGGSLETLTRNKVEAFALLRLALRAPRFDEEPVARMKEANLLRIRSSMTDPEWMAARLMNDRAFAGHPYAMNAGGTLSSMAALTPADLRMAQTTYLTRDRLLVAVAGDISSAELAATLDAVFGALPEKAPAKTVPDFIIQNQGTLALFEKDIPQTVLSVMMPAFNRDDPDYFPLQVTNYIFGGAGFGSRLMEEARERRGLTYGIYSGIDNYRHTDVLSIGTSTKNETAGEIMSIISAEMEKMRDASVTEQELADAKSYITGSMPLALSSTGKIAGMVLSLRVDSLPIDYLDTYADKINAVTANDILRVSGRVLHPDTMTAVMVGKPANVSPAQIVTELPNVE